MPYLTWILAFLAVTSLPCTLAAGGTPRQIAGFILGSNVDQYRESLDLNTALPMRNAGYLTEAEIKATEGFRSGSVVFGNCENPGKILRIKLKYLREDRAFFDELLKRFQDRFGKASQYKGDPFRQFLAWKWSFTDGKGERISLILQHNSLGDDEYPSGNSVKLSMMSEIEKERACFKKKSAQLKEDQSNGPPKGGKESMDFRRFIPE